MAAAVKSTTRRSRCSSARRSWKAGRRAADHRGAVRATETAGGGPRLPDGPGVTRIGGPETEIAIGDPDPEKAIGEDPVQAVAVASATRGARETTAGPVATAEIETEEAATVSPGQAQLEPRADKKTTQRDGVPRVERTPFRPLAGTGTIAEPSAMPAQAARRSPETELWCLGSWRIPVMTSSSEALVFVYVIRMFGGQDR